MAASIIPYSPPDFLQDQDVDSIYNRMKSTAPPDLDTSEASMFWDHTRPVAIEKSEMVQMQLNETIQVCFPQWSYDEYLDLHAEMAGLSRRQAVSATGIVTITGQQGTFLPVGSLFATPAVGDQPSITFMTKSAIAISGSGTAQVDIEAVTPGVTGNVAVNTITLLIEPIPGITGITNDAATSGGADRENDESFRSRILEAKKITPMSGSVTDYIIWAKEVPGVGEVYVISEWQGPGTGTVKLILVDSNGQPANTALVQAVQNHISPVDGTGLAPIGAIVTAAAPSAHTLNYSFALTVKEDADREATIELIEAAFTEYYKVVGVGGLVKYNTIAARIATTEGVDDFGSLLINGGTVNIQIAGDAYPVTGTVTAT